MNKINYLKVFSLVAFVCLGAVSCWATAESLHLLLSSWPKVMCWIVTVCFFLISSVGVKLVSDSLDKNSFVSKRGTRLAGGLLILLFFWLLCSMPTNTHTFFYRSVISDKVAKDISTTQGYLSQIQNNVVTQDAIKLKIAELEDKVESKLVELAAEIQNPNNPGNGPETKRILRDLAPILGVDKIEPLSGIGNSVQDRQRLVDAYRAKIYAMRDAKEKNIVAQMTPSSNDYQRQAATDYKNLDLVKKYIDEGKLNLNVPKNLDKVCDKLNSGYATIRTYNQFVDFKSSADEAAYMNDNAVTSVQRMKSVFAVWKDFIAGKYAGLGFIFWVLISILVDIAGFVFFAIAFKKNQI